MRDCELAYGWTYGRRRTTKGKGRWRKASVRVRLRSAGSPRGKAERLRQRFRVVDHLGGQGLRRTPRPAVAKRRRDRPARQRLLRVRRVLPLRPHWIGLIGRVSSRRRLPLGGCLWGHPGAPSSTQMPVPSAITAKVIIIQLMDSPLLPARSRRGAHGRGAAARDTPPARPR
jgi:hypothetical protein